MRIQRIDARPPIGFRDTLEGVMPDAASPKTMPSTPRNRIGEIYGQLTVVRSSDRRTKGGNAFWWCRCSCGREREVPGDKLSHNIKRRKPTVTACESCARERQIEAVCSKNDREERQRRIDAELRRKELVGVVPDRWLMLPLTDAHARELGKTLFFRGIRCLRGHIAPYRINGGCLACAGQLPSADSAVDKRPSDHGLG